MRAGSPLAVEPADRDRPRLVADAGDPDLERPGWQEGQELVRPLDDRHAVALQELRDPEVHQLGEAQGAVGVHGVDGQAAAWSATPGAIPRASKAPRSPVRTSPVPPDAMPGFPVGFTKTRPSGSPITLQAPLRTTCAPWRAAKSRTVAIRSRWTSGTEAPSKRAISPGWGVSVRAAGAARSTSGWPASAL